MSHQLKNNTPYYYKNFHYKIGPLVLSLTFYDGLSTTNIFINQTRDEWFLVDFIKTQPIWPNNDNTYYKCDQVTGVIKLLLDKGFIKSKKLI